MEKSAVRAAAAHPADKVSIDLVKPNPAGLAVVPAVSDIRIRRAEKKPISVGVIGYGYWGPNIVRNFQLQDESEVAVVCDRRPEALAKAARTYPNVEVTTDIVEVLKSPNVDVVAVVTPVWTHFELAKAALENGKHVFVEKPFTATAEQAETLIELAERKNLQIMVDHTFLFTGAVRKMKHLIDAGELGEL
jgi:predicted dehydrogenase